MTVEGPITVDGPVASGKTTVGRALAKRLGWTFIDTGLLYRAVGLLALRANITNWDDDNTIAGLARQTTMTISAGRLRVDGEDVTDLITTPAAAGAASRVAVLSGVRRVLVDMQRGMADMADGRVVMVGRDIGTVVLTDAPVKIYLDASPEARAERRFREMRERGEDVVYADLLAQISARDRRDTERSDSPLRPAIDAHVINTDSLSPEQVVDHILAIAAMPA